MLYWFECLPLILLDEDFSVLKLFEFALPFNQWSAYSRLIVLFFFFLLQEFYTSWALDYLKIALSDYGRALIFGWITYSL